MEFPAIVPGDRDTLAQLAPGIGIRLKDGRRLRPGIGTLALYRGMERGEKLHDRHRQKIPGYRSLPRPMPVAAAARDRISVPRL